MDSLNESLQNSLPDYAYSPLEKQHYHPFHLYKNLTIFILFLIISLLVVLSVGYITLVSKVQQRNGSQKHTATPPPVACTQDAKQCPDGSYVSRTGPDCEFAPCPLSSQAPSLDNPQDKQSKPTNDTATWKIYRNDKFSYEVKYPSDWEIVEAKQRIGTESVWTGSILIEEEKEIQKVSFVNKSGKFSQGWFEIRVLENPDRSDLSQWMARNKPENATSISNTLLNGLHAKTLFISTLSYPGNIGIVTVYKENVYFITMEFANISSEVPDDYQELFVQKQTYDQILSTFKFLPASPTGGDQNQDYSVTSSPH